MQGMFGMTASYYMTLCMLHIDCQICNVLETMHDSSIRMCMLHV